MENTEKQQHECNFDIVFIRNDDIRRFNGSDIPITTKFVRVDIDCGCEESQPAPFAQFYETSIMSAEDNFKGWFCQCAPWFIQNNFKIKDLRDEN